MCLGNAGTEENMNYVATKVRPSATAAESYLGRGRHTWPAKLEELLPRCSHSNEEEDIGRARRPDAALTTIEESFRERSFQERSLQLSDLFQETSVRFGNSETLEHILREGYEEPTSASVARRPAEEDRTRRGIPNADVSFENSASFNNSIEAFASLPSVAAEGPTSVSKHLEESLRSMRYLEESLNSLKCPGGSVSPSKGPDKTNARRTKHCLEQLMEKTSLDTDCRDQRRRRSFEALLVDNSELLERSFSELDGSEHSFYMRQASALNFFESRMQARSMRKASSMGEAGDDYMRQASSLNLFESRRQARLMRKTSSMGGRPPEDENALHRHDHQATLSRFAKSKVSSRRESFEEIVQRKMSQYFVRKAAESDVSLAEHQNPRPKARAREPFEERLTGRMSKAAAVEPASSPSPLISSSDKKNDPPQSRNKVTAKEFEELVKKKMLQFENTAHMDRHQRMAAGRLERKARARKALEERLNRKMSASNIIPSRKLSHVEIQVRKTNQCSIAKSEESNDSSSLSLKVLTGKEFEECTKNEMSKCAAVSPSETNSEERIVNNSESEGEVRAKEAFEERPKRKMRACQKFSTKKESFEETAQRKTMQPFFMGNPLLRRVAPSTEEVAPSTEENASPSMQSQNKLRVKVDCHPRTAARVPLPPPTPALELESSTATVPNQEDAFQLSLLSLPPPPEAETGKPWQMKNATIASAKKMLQRLKRSSQEQSLEQGLQNDGNDLTLTEGTSNGGNHGPERCVICLDLPRTHAFVPCGHMCACRECSQILMETTSECPLCNQDAIMVMEVQCIKRRTV